MKLTDNFRLEEFASPDVDYFPIDVINNLYVLACDLEVIRGVIERPIFISSGWRTKSHNDQVGGVPDSQHLSGKAADIWVTDMTSLELWRIILRLRYLYLKPGGTGLYNSFVHYDIRGENVEWDYRKKIKS